MREEDITRAIKDLSLEAWVLGFPQEVKRGDWYLINREAVLCNYSEGTIRGFDPKKHAMVLDFFRCLAWLRVKGWELQNLMVGCHPSEGQYWIAIRQSNYEGRAFKWAAGDYLEDFGPTIDEAAIKLVNKVLELERKG